MFSAFWIGNTAGHVGVNLDGSSSPMLLQSPDEVADFVRTNAGELDDSLLMFLGQSFAVLCFRAQMGSVRDPVHMKDQLKRLIDAIEPRNLPTAHQSQAFESGISHVLKAIRSNLRADFATLLNIMVTKLQLGQLPPDEERNETEVELYRYLHHLQENLRQRGASALAETVCRASTFAGGSTSEYYAETRSALKTVAAQHQHILADREIGELMSWLTKIDAAFMRVGGA